MGLRNFPIRRRRTSARRREPQRTRMADLFGSGVQQTRCARLAPHTPRLSLSLTFYNFHYYFIFSFWFLIIILITRQLQLQLDEGSLQFFSCLFSSELCFGDCTCVYPIVSISVCQIHRRVPEQGAVGLFWTLVDPLVLAPDLFTQILFLVLSLSSLICLLLLFPDDLIFYWTRTYRLGQHSKVLSEHQTKWLSNKSAPCFS